MHECEEDAEWGCNLQVCQCLGSQSIVADDKAANIFTYTDTPLGMLLVRFPSQIKVKYALQVRTSREVINVLHPITTN